MNKKLGILIVTVLALGVLLFWARQQALRTPERNTAAPAAAPAGDGFGEIMNELSRDMSRWPQLSAEQKQTAVSAVMQLFRQQGQGNISMSPEFYVRQIDQTLAANPDSRNLALDRLLFILAVMSYDFDNGQDRDELARRVLGEEVYTANKARLEAARQQAQAPETPAA